MIFTATAEAKSQKSPPDRTVASDQCKSQAVEVTRLVFTQIMGATEAVVNPPNQGGWSGQEGDENYVWQILATGKVDGRAVTKNARAKFYFGGDKPCQFRELSFR